MRVRCKTIISLLSGGTGSWIACLMLLPALQSCSPASDESNTAKKERKSTPTKKATAQSGSARVFANPENSPNGFVPAKLRTPSGEQISVQVAFIAQSRRQGFSGVRPSQVKADEGVFFHYDEEGIKQFWMPDTYFNLDIFFLTEDLTIKDIARDMPHHPGRKEPPPIPSTQPVKCRYVLELKADSALSDNLRKGMQLQWADAPDFP